MIKTSEEIKNEYERLQKRFIDIKFNQECDFTDSNKFCEIKNKEWVEVSDINKIPNKSLESTGLDLCGYSQDDVWEKAIEWFEEQCTK